MKKNFLILITCSLLGWTGTSFAATVSVNSISRLQTAINHAEAGDRIIVEDGVYTTTDFIMVECQGTAADPIIIEAETILGVEITGTSGFYINKYAKHVTVKGFHFTHSTDLDTSGTSKIKEAQFCRFTRNFFNCTGSGDLLTTTGADTQIDHNEFSYQNPDVGEHMIYVWGTIDRVWIHHNYFHDQNRQHNGTEVIKYGTGTQGSDSTHGLIEYNLIERCEGDYETISNKSNGNTYRYNTLIDCRTFTLRGGDDCVVYGNYIRNSEGLRVYGARHQIFSNYFEGCTRGVSAGNGLDTSYAAADDCVIAYNTFINNNVHYLRSSHGNVPPTHVTVANNIMQGGGNMGWVSEDDPYTGTWEGNIGWNCGTGNMPAEGYTIVDPQLATDANGVYRLQAGSPAINAGAGSYAFVDVDIDGQTRDVSPDVGADEVSRKPILNRPLTKADVGPFAKNAPSP